MKTVEELQGELSTLLDSAKALAEINEADGLSDEQSAEFDTLTADDGQIAAKREELDKAKAYRAKLDAIERNRQALAGEAPRIGRNIDQSETTEAKPAASVDLKGQRHKHFADAREAHLAGQWFAWATAPTREARDQHAAEMERLGSDTWKRYAAQSIGTAGKGGYLVPEPIATEIIKNRDAVAVAPQLANVISMASETLRINEESGDTTVYYPGESSAITLSDVDWTQHTLTVAKRAAMVKMSREFIADSNVSAADQIVDNLSYRFAYAMDNEFINGDGSGTYGSETGLIGAIGAGGTVTAASGEDTIAELDIDDFVAVKRQLPLKFQQGAAWLFNPDAWYQVESLLMAAGGAATTEFVRGLDAARTFMGKPVYLSALFPAEAASTFVAFYGSFRRGVAIGDRNDMSIETSTERYFETDDVAIRATHRYDILVHNAGDGSNAGAYVGLQLAAS